MNYKYKIKFLYSVIAVLFGQCCPVTVQLEQCAGMHSSPVYDETQKSCKSLRRKNEETEFQALDLRSDI